MGQHQIVEKLKLELKGEINSERQVVYILVEIGKLLEHEKAKKAYPAITFYRDWAVHTRLDLSEQADALVRSFDEYIASNNKTASARLKELVTPQTLRRQLGAYLRLHHLTFSSCTDGILWKRFVKYLAGVIDETPLHCSLRNKTARITHHVESVMVYRSRNKNGTAMLTWSAKCHTPPPPGIQSFIEVVLLPDIDNVALP
jgi:hypothetical protein